MSYKHAQIFVTPRCVDEVSRYPVNNEEGDAEEELALGWG